MRIREQPRQSRNRGSIRGYPGPQISALLGHRSSDGGPLHLPLVVHDNTGVVLEIDKLAVLSPEGLPLANDDGWHNLLPELWFTLLDCSQDHVATAGSRQPVEPAPDTVHSWSSRSSRSCRGGIVKRSIDGGVNRIKHLLVAQCRLVVGFVVITVLCRSGLRLSFIGIVCTQQTLNHVGLFCCCCCGYCSSCCWSVSRLRWRQNGEMQSELALLVLLVQRTLCRSVKVHVPGHALIGIRLIGCNFLIGGTDLYWTDLMRAHKRFILRRRKGRESVDETAVQIRIAGHRRLALRQRLGW